MRSGPWISYTTLSRRDARIGYTVLTTRPGFPGVYSSFFFDKKQKTVFRFFMHYYYYYYYIVRFFFLSFIYIRRTPSNAR